MKQSYLITALEAIGTVCVLCAVILLMGTPKAEVQTAFGEEDGAVSLPILMYHSVLQNPSQQGTYVISPKLLEQDLDYLVAQGYETVTAADLVAYTRGEGDLPAKPVMITFDDGNFNNYHYAYPMLKARGMRAELAVIGKQTQIYTEAETENANWSYLTRERLATIQDVFEIANHSFDLHEMGVRRGCARFKGEEVERYRAILAADTAQTQDYITAAGVAQPICYAYPFGVYCEESEEVLGDMGYLCTLTCNEHINTITRDPESLYLLGRYNRPGELSTDEFMKERMGI